MNKIMLSYLAGALTTTAAVYLAAGRTSYLITFGAFLAVLILAVAFGAKPRRAALGRFLLRSAGVAERPAAARISTQAKPQAAPRPKLSPEAADVQNALIGLGMPKARAAAVAIEAARSGGTLADMIRRGTQAAAV